MENKQAAIPKKRVLLVDDDLELTLIYQQLLETYNYEVATASDGDLALKHVLRQDIDAILCDLRMPELQGDMFYRAVERVKPRLCCRFIFITCVADDPKYRAFVEQVKLPVLRKPVEPGKLLEALEKLLGPQT